jgi:hypothetical protein
MPPGFPVYLLGDGAAINPVVSGFDGFGAHVICLCRPWS